MQVSTKFSVGQEHPSTLNVQLTKLARRFLNWLEGHDSRLKTHFQFILLEFSDGIQSHSKGVFYTLYCVIAKIYGVFLFYIKCTCFI